MPLTLTNAHFTGWRLVSTLTVLKNLHCFPTYSFRSKNQPNLFLTTPICIYYCLNVLLFPVSNIGGQSWAPESMKQCNKAVNTSYLLPTLNASSLHRINFQQHYAFYIFIASQICLSCLLYKKVKARKLKR